MAPPDDGRRQSDPEDFGPDGMAGYIKSHMRFILQPFAENVEELHKTVLCLAGNLQSIKAKTDTNTSTISQHSAAISTLQADFSNSQKAAAETLELLEQTRKEKEALEGRMEDAERLSKQTAETLDDFVASNSKAMNELKTTLDDTRNRLKKCQETANATKVDLVRSNASVERLRGDMTATNQVQDRTDKNVAALKSSIENCLQGLTQVTEEQNVRYVKYESFSEEADNKFSEANSRLAEVEKQLADVSSYSKSINDVVGRKVSARLDAHNSVVEGVKDKLREVDGSVADIRSLTLNHFEDVSKLVKLSEKRQLDSLQAVSRNLDTTAADSSQMARMTRELYGIIKGTGQGTENNFQILQDDVRFALRRANRLEGIMGLEPLSKEEDEGDTGLVFKNGILLTDEQIRNFEETFHRYDKDNDNSITVDEIGNVMMSLGHDVPQEAVAYVVKTIDSDNSGEINFDEFCTLMGKMLGPDGKVDVDGYMKLISEEAMREARQNEVVELVPKLKEQVTYHKALFEEKDKQLTSANNRLSSLEGSHADLLEEVKKLRDGFETNQKHWKGLSQGLKETSRQVGTEGDGEMLPKAAKLRSVLPPVGMRPISARNHYVPCKSPDLTASARTTPGPASPGWA